MTTATTVTGVSVLDKAMAIVGLCEVSPRTVAQVAEELEMPAPTTHRLVRALRAHSLLARDDDGRLRPGARFRSSHLEQVARPVLRALTEATGETAQLWVRRGEMRLCLASELSRHPLRAELPEGALIPLERGGTSARALQAELAPEGWAETIVSITPGLSGVSVPVHAGGEIAGAVCLVGPTFRVTSSMGAQYGAQVLEAADAIERALGDEAS